MKKEALIERTTELINQAHRSMLDNIEKAISSGSMNIEEAEDNYMLPKALFLALLKEETKCLGIPFKDRKDFTKTVDKIYASL